MKHILLIFHSLSLCLQHFPLNILSHGCSIYSFLLVSPSYTLCMSREHRVQEGKVVFPLGASVQGDVVVSVYHMRSTIGGRLQAKVNFVCSVLYPRKFFNCKSQQLLRDQTKNHVCVLVKSTC